jgi:DNA helicase II / ATP-dependent DNA helicase PcrA
MVETRLGLEPEVQSILQTIDEGHHFLLSGGAGSGKTYSLVQVIKQVISEKPFAKVACMTYTNAAVKEIEDRVNHHNLAVSTIHDFLWDNIKHFQKELKLCLVELANDATVAAINIDDRSDIPTNYFDAFSEGIQYKEYLRLREGIISHDEILVLANKLFESYPKIGDIVKDKYNFLFIDEYQDTNALVIEILLNHFNRSNKKNTLGFFGDAMQAIYEDGVGNLDAFTTPTTGSVIEIKKTQNRRNPQKVIDLANIIRTDGITQVPSTDSHAPNMSGGVIKGGNIKFIYSKNPDFTRVRQYLRDTLNWPVDDPSKTKELNLTHNLIAGKAEFRSLMDIYDGDKILDYRKRIRDYIKRQAITEDFSSKTFGQVIDHLKIGKTGTSLNAINPTAGQREFIDNHPDPYNVALNYNYPEFVRIYVDSSQLVDDKKQSPDEENKKGSKRDNLIKHLYKIQNNIALYTDRQFNEFLRVTDFRSQIVSIESKRVLKANIESLINVGDKTIEQVINEANDLRICLIDESLEKFVREKTYIYDQAKKVKYNEFQKLYFYLEGLTPFSTQHKTKGREFHTVLVVLDNGGWNRYNFEYLFLNSGTQSVLERTQKIFYVCCTRAMENLAVFFHDPNSDVINKAKQWFGEENVLRLLVN